MPPTLLEVAREHQRRLDQTAQEAGNRASRIFRRMDPSNLDLGWQYVAPELESTVSRSQVSAARQSTAYVNRAGLLQGADMEQARLVPEAFAGVTKDGRGLAPEMFTAVTVTKKLIGGGVSVPAAFRAGAHMMSVIAATAVRDMGRSADQTIATGKGFLFSVRVVSAGACSRCAILAGVKGYKVDFERHPNCRCTAMPLADADTPPEGFHRSADDYFQSLDESEQDRVFTKSGAFAIRNGADPAKVVNARRGAYKESIKRPDGTFGPARLRPITIGTRADGSPLQVYATTEGTSVRGSFGRLQSDLRMGAGDRYRTTQTVRLMPEQIMQMGGSPERVRELLQRYGYLY